MSIDTSWLEIIALVVAIVSIVLAIWDKVRVWFWDRYAPVRVEWDPEVVDELQHYRVALEGMNNAARVRFSVKNRVDYRLQLFVTVRSNFELLKHLDQELLDQIDSRVIARTGNSQLITDIEPFQSRHLVLRLTVKGSERSGIAIPSVSFLVGQRPLRHQKRSSEAPLGIEVKWADTIHRFNRVETPPVPGP